MPFRISASHLRRAESLTALLVGAFLAAVGGWAQVSYSSLQERVAAWRLVGEEVRVNRVLLQGHRALGSVRAEDVSPTAERRYNILIPSMVLTRGYDVLTEKGLQDVSANDIVGLSAYYLDLRTLNERIGMLENFLTQGTLVKSDAALMPILIRHYNSVAAASVAPLERTDALEPVVTGIVRRLDARQRRLRHAFTIFAVSVGVVFIGVLGLGAAGFVREDELEKAA